MPDGQNGQNQLHSSGKAAFHGSGGGAAVLDSVPRRCHRCGRHCPLPRRGKDSEPTGPPLPGWTGKCRAAALLWQPGRVVPWLWPANGEEEETSALSRQVCLEITAASMDQDQNKEQESSSCVILGIQSQTEEIFR